jgi:hypothetical protein
MVASEISKYTVAFVLSDVTWPCNHYMMIDWLWYTCNLFKAYFSSWLIMSHQKEKDQWHTRNGKTRELNLKMWPILFLLDNNRIMYLRWIHLQPKWRSKTDSPKVKLFSYKQTSQLEQRKKKKTLEMPDPWYSVTWLWIFCCHIYTATNQFLLVYKWHHKLQRHLCTLQLHLYIISESWFVVVIG